MGAVTSMGTIPLNTATTVPTDTAATEPTDTAATVPADAPAQFFQQPRPCLIPITADQHSVCTYTLFKISEVAGIDLVPVMDLEISHVNATVPGTTTSRPTVRWHTDSYPFVVVLSLSKKGYMKGGETLLKSGSGAVRNTGILPMVKVFTFRVVKPLLTIL